MHYNVTRENGEILNVFVWFGNSKIHGCENALLLQGGDLVLLKAEKTYSEAEWRRLKDDYLPWREEFGTGQASDFLRAALSYRDKVLPSFYLPFSESRKND